MKESCASCKFYKAIKDESDLGHCRHDRPMLIEQFLNPREGIAPNNLLASTVWPVVSQNAWCGEYVESQVTDDELKDWLILDVKSAAQAGFPFTATGVKGLYANREKLSYVLRGIAVKKLERMARDLINNHKIVKCRAGGGAVQWLDVPYGPFAMGKGRLMKGSYFGRAEN